MSISFSIAGSDPYKHIQLSTRNAAALLEWLAILDEGAGALPARQMTAIVRWRLRPENRMAGDEGIPKGNGYWRDAGYLAQLAEQLLKLAESAGDDGEIAWG